jgi:hypothetical protein
MVLKMIKQNITLESKLAFVLSLIWARFCLRFEIVFSKSKFLINKISKICNITHLVTQDGKLVKYA